MQSAFSVMNQPILGRCVLRSIVFHDGFPAALPYRVGVSGEDRILRKADELSCLSSRINALHYRLVGLNHPRYLDLLL